ncbi:replication protein [Achromobacter sp. NPDC008082]|jgi:phage replication O-like protein O|uniref:replication protein n=1 Tax=Achromobacter sp. NPDC008082 TaxID=3363888 RepID=UPI0036E9F442
MSDGQKISPLEDRNTRPAGHTQIANELLEAITMHAFKQTTLRVLLALVRKTIGFNKKEDDLSASQLGSLLGQMKRQHITTALNELAAMRVIHKRPGRYGSVVGINTDFSQWLSRPASGQESESEIAPCPSIGQAGSPDAGHTKDNLPKDNRQNTDLSAEGSANGELKLWSATRTAVSPVAALLPLADGAEHAVAPQQIVEWTAAFPAVDVLGELLRMRAWLDANRAQRKTRRGIDRFIVSWLARAQRDTGKSLYVRPSRDGNPLGGQIHGNFNQQDYRFGVSEDGRF